MDLKISFLGAAGNVTGSAFLIEAGAGAGGTSRFLVDCGFYQEHKLKERNWAPFPVDPAGIDAILITHAHLDHCGLIPKLKKDGFNGKIYCTKATADIAAIVLLDSAKIQEEDAEHKRKRHEREERKGPYQVAPLYTTEDAEACLPLFQPVAQNSSVTINEGIEAQFRTAGHILGSSMIRITVGTGREQRSILVSGDVGRCDAPIINDPAKCLDADYILIESTYGNRIHEPTADINESLARVVTETVNAGGNVVIPSFAIERTQELLYRLGELFSKGSIPRLPVFVDSPMAIKVTEVFRRHPELFDKDARELLERGGHPCDFPGLVLSRTVEESKAINEQKGQCIIIAGSGMCAGGRIKHHLISNIGRPESTILFVGYQAVGTLGRIILDGAEEVRIHGKDRAVKARIERIRGFSAHADKNELLSWISTLKRPPRHVFVVHGEPDAAEAFARLLHDKNGWTTSVPEYRQTVTLD